MSRADRWTMVGIFFGFFGLYLHTCAPHLAPYRDAGEMVSLLATLGVAHPPGYPLYTLIGRLATLVPLGDMAYRVNFFSALCAAGALVFLFLVLRTWLGKMPALLAASFLGFSNPFWDLATVSEMYALGALFFCGLLLVTFRLKNPLLFAFLMALGLGVRMDMLLLIPIFLAWFWFQGARREFPWMAGFFIMGASVFLYLMVRSLGDPLMDWANPDNLLAVFNSARRKNYSGTLDLLSLSYRSGENFLINLQLYGKHIVGVFGWWGAAGALLGAVGIWRSQRREAFFFGALFFVTCPFFLYLANMPPNPHALAIVEASYLVPDILIAIFIAFGVSPSSWHVFSQDPSPGVDPGLRHSRVTIIRAGATGVVGLLCLSNAVHGFSRASKRHNLYARDYIENVFRSAPRNAVAVFQKDVQLFSLWEAQLVGKRRPDLSLVSVGLSGSPWYWDMKRRWKTAPSPEISLKEPDGWPRLLSEIGARPLVASYDVELKEEAELKYEPHGMLLKFRRPGMSQSRAHASSKGGSWIETFQDDRLLSHLCLYRGRYVYGETPDFFSTDLIGDAARAHHQQGFHLMLNAPSGPADYYFRRAESMDPTFARASSDRGYLYYTKNDVAGAYALYAMAARKIDKTLALTAEYKSLPAVVESYRAEASAVNTQWGAMAERLGRHDEARQLYLRALSINENAQAHYNLAVTYWGTNWPQVIAHLRRALELNPQMNEARGYLAKAMAMSGKS